MDELVKLFSALLTPTIAIVTTYIAIQQYKLSKLKARHDLFDRRLTVYRAIMEFLSSTARHNGDVEQSAVKMIREAADSYFIFKPDITEYIKTIYNKGIDLGMLNMQLSDKMLERNDRKQISKERGDLIKWFGLQYDVTTEKFRKYLALET